MPDASQTPSTNPPPGAGAEDLPASHGASPNGSAAQNSQSAANPPAPSVGIDAAAVFGAVPRPEHITALPESPIERELLGRLMAIDPVLKQLFDKADYIPVTRHLGIHERLMSCLEGLKQSDSAEVSRDLHHIIYEALQNSTASLPWTLHTLENSANSLPLDGAEDAPRHREWLAGEWVLRSIDFCSDKRLSKELLLILDQKMHGHMLALSGTGDHLMKPLLRLAAEPSEFSQQAGELVARYVSNSVARSAILKAAAGGDGRARDIEGAYQRFTEAARAEDPTYAVQHAAPRGRLAWLVPSFLRKGS